MNTLAFKYSEACRVFYSYGKSVPEAAVVHVNASGDLVTPYFDQGKVRRLTMSYLSKSMKVNKVSWTVKFSGSPSTSYIFKYRVDISKTFRFIKNVTFSIKEGGIV